MTSLAISAATSAASFLVTKIFQPKAKPQDVNKISSSFKISNVGEDLFINEFAGARGADGFGGIEVGVIFIWASDIRKVVVETSSSGGGQSGGKGGGSKAPANREHHYYIDLICLIGRGRNRALEIKAGTDVLFRNYPKPSAIQGISYEAELATLGGGASQANDGAFSGGKKVNLPNGGTMSFSVVGEAQAHAIYFQYKSSVDAKLNATINGTAQTVALPETFGRIETVMVVGTMASGATNVFLQNPGTSIEFDKIIVGEVFAQDTETIRFGGLSGLRDENYVNPLLSYDHLSLVNPLSEDYRGQNEFNYQPNTNNLGEVSTVGLPAGCQLRIYEGTDTQLPDPLYQAYCEAKYGAGSTPAFRNRNYFVLENFEITKYGSVPNITATVESIDNASLGDLYRSRSLRAGLTNDEIDYSAFNDIPLRGFVIGNRQAPRTEMENLNRILDIDVIEDDDGVIRGVIPDETVIAEIPFTDLDAGEKKGDENKQPIALETVVVNDYEVAKRLDLSYFDPAKSFEVANAHATREITVSEKRENIETSLVLTQDEAQKMVDRLHQKEWAEKDAHSFTTFYKYGYLKPCDLVKVQDLSGNYNQMRLKSRNGNIPGALKFAGVSREILESFPRIFNEPSNAKHLPPWVKVPGHVVGTLFDGAILRTSENVPGIYAACALTDQAYSFSGASLFWERETGYQLLNNFPNQATLGRTLTGTSGTLGDAVLDSDGWDVTHTVTFDLFFGEVETHTDDEVLDRFNILIVGGEVIAFANATRITGYPNRWTVSRLRRGLKGTSSSAHAATERVLLLTDAVRFIPLDLSEAEQTRNYKFVSSGQLVESASSFSFKWEGNSQYNTPAYQITDKDVPTLRPMDSSANSGLPKVSTIPGQSGKEWIVQIPTPLKNGASLKNIQLYVLNSTNYKTVSGSYSATATSITLNNAIGLPNDGRIYIGQGPNDGTDEIISYTGISGNTLTGVTRGVDGTTARALSNSQIIFQIQFEFNLGAKYTHSMIQMDNSMIFIYRLQNGYFLSGKQGYSLWSGGTIGYGFGSGSANPAPAPPSSTPQPPPDGYEDPFDPGNVGRDYELRAM